MSPPPDLTAVSNGSAPPAGDPTTVMARPESKSRFRITIVGGGAGGTVVAYNLARQLPEGFEADILLIERSGIFGPGVPYLTGNPEHRLNVVTARMSALHDEPDHFLRWMKEREPQAHGDDYVPRGVYGEYLKDLLDAAAASMPRGVRLRRITDEVTSLRITPKSVTVRLKHGADFRSDRVVIATGPLPGGDPVEVPQVLRDDGTWINNAWDERAIEPAMSDEDVLVIGTGLTMIDAAISLAGSPYGPVVRAISRSGLIPKPHRPGYTTVSELKLPPTGPLSINDAMGIFLAEECRLQVAGGDWRDAMDSMRRVTPELWRRMPLKDRKWFLNNVQRVWEVHRFRMAPEIARRYDELVLEGRIVVSAGRVARLEPSTGGAIVSLATLGGTEKLEVQHVINSTGASGNILDDPPPLIRELIEAGYVRPDDLLLGLDVTPEGRAITASGAISEHISVIGSLRRGVEWESIGMTELKKQAPVIAEGLARDLVRPAVAR